MSSGNECRAVISVVWEEMRVAVKLSEARGEDRVRSLKGLYLVVAGFLLQLTGLAIALIAAL